jgi:Family of unknown function (DUF6345)/Transposase
MKKPLKRYDATFKRDAVELLLTSGKPLKALAVELGVCDVTLRNWRDRHLHISTNYTDITGTTNYQIDTFIINTCEWGNETHTLFATAECQSGFGDAPNSGPVATGHGVSQMVPVLFSNLVERISFALNAFDPALGQTQKVNAVFAQNSDWTLTVQDVFSNTVVTSTGSGDSMEYDWNGTSGGTNVPAGIYFYYISAETNGSTSSFVSGGSESLSTSSSLDESNSLWVLSSDSNSVCPLKLYPSNFNTNALTIFSATPSEIASLSPSLSSSGSGFTPAAAGGSSAASQNAPRTPRRPPTSRAVGTVGTFGIVYDTYSANGTNGINLNPLPDGSGIVGRYIRFQSFTASSALNYPPLLPFKQEADYFIYDMGQYGWRKTIHKVDNEFTINDLRGSSTSFNQVDLGVMMFHGTFGTTMDFAAGLCQQMYYAVTSGGSGQYLRLSEMSLGGSDPTNGLKWFAIMACNSLQHTDWANMQSHGIKPYNNNLHLLLGTDSTNVTSPTVLKFWADYMNYGVTNFGPMTVKDSWFQAGKNAYKGVRIAFPMKFAVAGDTACQDDYVQPGFSSPPAGTQFYNSQTIYTP